MQFAESYINIWQASANKAISHGRLAIARLRLIAALGFLDVCGEIIRNS
jgi:hypothetical protein